METLNNSESHLGGNINFGDPHTHSPDSWDYLIKRFSPRSVLDVGSGRSYSSSYFYRAGLQVIAVDGLRENCEKAVYPTLQVDLSKTSVFCPVDLVHCQELVEHVEEQYVENVLQTLANGRFIVMTNALPGQGGYHHVNEKPTEYWIAHLERYGYSVLPEDTNRLRRIAANEGAIYLAKTGLILWNNDRF